MIIDIKNVPIRIEYKNLLFLIIKNDTNNTLNISNDRIKYMFFTLNSPSIGNKYIVAGFIRIGATVRISNR